MTWITIIGMSALFLAFYLYRFSKHMKKYLSLYEVRIISNEKETNSIRINVTAVFCKGNFKREYFTVIGSFRSNREFSVQMSKEMLSLTEINSFYDGPRLKTKEIYHNYTYFNSFQEASSNSDYRDYEVTFVVLDKAAIDFAKSHLES